MGADLSKIPERMAEKSAENMAKGQANMLARQIEMQQEAARRQMAMSIASTRDLFNYFGGFCAVAFPLLLIGATRKRNPAMAAPILPLSFVLAFQYDLAYHTKMDRILTEADALLEQHPEKFRLPGPTLSVPWVDAVVQRKGTATGERRG